MGRRALFWSGAVLIGLIVQQAAVSFFGAGANYWLGVAALVILLLSVCLLYTSPSPRDS